MADSIQMTKSVEVDHHEALQQQATQNSSKWKESCMKHHIGLYCGHLLLLFVCFLVGAATSYVTYRTQIIVPFLWCLCCVFQSVLFLFILLLIFGTFHIAICILQKSDKFSILHQIKLPKICPFVCQISCCLYLSIIAMWYTLIGIIVIIWHPYLIGEFEIDRPNSSDYSSDGISFRPWPQTVQYKGELHFPQNVSEIISLINNTNEENAAIVAQGGDPKLVRMIGSGHSWSPQFSNDILIGLDNFNDIYISINDSDSYNETELEFESEIPYVIVGAGAIIGDVEDALFELGYVLWGFGAAQFQTMGGMMGHGVGNTFGYMGQYCTDYWLVDGNGIDRHISKDENQTLLQAARVNGKYMNASKMQKLCQIAGCKF